MTENVDSQCVKSIYNKVNEYLEFELGTETKKYTERDFERRIKNIVLSDQEKSFLKLKTNEIDNFQIIKHALSLFGIDVITQNRNKRNKKKSIVKYYILSVDREIYEILYCMISKERNNFDQNFLTKMDNYDKYKQYLITE